MTKNIYSFLSLYFTERPTRTLRSHDKLTQQNAAGIAFAKHFHLAMRLGLEKLDFCFILEMKKIITVLLLMVILFSGLIVSAKEDLYSKFGVKQLKIEPLAPDFTLKNLDGKEINLKDFKGKTVLLNFWATWCEPCLEEMPAMQKAYNTLRDKGFVILAVSIDRDSREKNVRAFAKKFGLSFHVLFDSKQRVRDKYFNNALPTSYLINTKGKLKGFIAGARDWGSNDAIALINNLIHNTD